MKISYHWLKEYLPLDLPPEKVAEYLTGCGLEVESLSKWQSVKGGLAGIVIGEVLTCAKHPNSDHLSLTSVNIGSGEPLKIVCGASNVAAGQKVAVATIGTLLTFGDKAITIQRSKIRGEVSEGMICAEDELGLGSSHDGILVLDPSAMPGTSGFDYFKLAEDVVFEIGLTPNRTDAMCHTGVARDLAAVLNNFGKESAGSGSHLAIQLPDVSGFKHDKKGRAIKVTVEDTDACPRYSGLTISGITVADSPAWLKNRLLAVGLRPINNIVDITNFILMELGQPLHAFDADRIAGDRIIVKKYPAETSFVTLDEVERKLSQHDLMICSETEPLCIAGVFGGIGSGVTTQTRNIFIESAYFNPRSIRKTSRYHGLQTDSSFRYERGANHEITVYALQRAALLITELAGGAVSSDIVDVYPAPIANPVVRLNFGHLDRLAGKTLNRGVVASIISDLGMKILEKTEEGLTLSVPGFKSDVTREADVIEEILRIYGYNNIEIPIQVRSSQTVSPKPDKEKLRTAVSDYLCSAGFFEIMNNSLTPSAWYEGDPVFEPGKLVRMINPLSRDLDALRQTLLFGGLETIAYNRNRKANDLMLFEFGSVYALAEKGHGDPVDGFHEETHLAMWMTGSRSGETWNAHPGDVDFFDLKGHLFASLRRINIEPADLEVRPFSSKHIQNGLLLLSGGKTLATAGMVSGSLLKQFDCRQNVFYADCNWELLAFLAGQATIRFKELARFPEVRRDLALLVDSSVEFAAIEALAFQTEKKLLKQVGLFDVFEGEKIGAGKKSYAISFTLLDEEKTLTDEEIDSVMQKLIKAFEQKIQAAIR